MAAATRGAMRRWRCRGGHPARCGKNRMWKERDHCQAQLFMRAVFLPVHRRKLQVQKLPVTVSTTPGRFA